MADHIDAVEASVDRAIPLSSLSDVAKENARKMFCALTMLLQRPPGDVSEDRSRTSRSYVRMLRTAAATEQRRSARVARCLMGTK